MTDSSRSKMISVRLTAEEYEAFRKVCFERSIGTVSELARIALQALLEKPTRVFKRTVEQRITNMESRLRLLGSEVSQLKRAQEQIAKTADYV